MTIVIVIAIAIIKNNPIVLCSGAYVFSTYPLITLAGSGNDKGICQSEIGCFWSLLSSFTRYQLSGSSYDHWSVQNAW